LVSLVFHPSENHHFLIKLHDTYVYTVKPVLRGHIWGKEKVSL